MANVFLNKTELMERDIETALLLEKAIVTDIGKAVAYTDGEKTFINTNENLEKILPAYDQRMLKWLLWHEKMHIELRHHNRFYKYLDELSKEDATKELHLTKEDINIIMDILVHDSLTKMFPELVETALTNLAQMRNRNSLGYTFKTHTLEEMLNEYKHKGDEEDGEGEESEDGEGRDPSDTKEKDHTESDTPEIEEDAEHPEEEPSTGLTDDHDKTDWSKLDDIDTKEFISEEESRHIQKSVDKLRRTKLKLAKLTETLNGLVTTTRKRTYAMPSPIHTGGGVLLKGSTPGKTQLYLIFDASGSMSSEMKMFQEIISKSIPQAMDVPCEWFAGWGAKIPPYKTVGYDEEGYYKSKFKDFMRIHANGGFSDDGDRTIDLCWQAEQAGYSPIGVTDGGGKISWSKDKLKQLKKTVLVGQNSNWLKSAKEFNPTIQIIDLEIEY